MGPEEIQAVSWSLVWVGSAPCQVRQMFLMLLPWAIDRYFCKHIVQTHSRKRLVNALVEPRMAVEGRPAWAIKESSGRRLDFVDASL